MQFCFAGVDPHSHTNNTISPGLGLQGLLGGRCGFEGLSRPVKSSAKSIADHLKDKAVVRFDRSPQELVVPLLGSVPAFGMLTREPGTALDVSEKERHRPRRRRHFPKYERHPQMCKMFLAASGVGCGQC